MEEKLTKEEKLQDKKQSNSFNLAAMFKHWRLDSNLMQLLIIVVVIFTVMTILKPGIFPTAQNISSMAFQLSEVGILAIAMMLAMLIGGIDLSVNSVANLAAILAGIFMRDMVPPDASGVVVAQYIAIGIGIALLTGVLCGLLSGFLIAYVGVPAILATLSTMTLYTGLAFGITKGSAVFGFPEPFLKFGNGFFLGIPQPLIVFAGIAIVMSIVLGQTTFGLRIYMLGTNATASRFSGINNPRVIMTTHMVTGLLASIAGIVILSRTNSANAEYGTSYVLVAILISVLGGVSVSGGFGKVLGVVLAILAMQQLSTGFNMLLFRFEGSNFFRDFAWGVLLLFVMVVKYYDEKRKLSAKRSK